MSSTLEIRDLRFRYPDGTEALRGINFSIADGECVALIGPNGAGKSTLLLHLNGLLPENLNGQSSIWMNGNQVTSSNLAEIRRQVGLLFQDPDDQLFCPTVGEDVAFGPQQLRLSLNEIRDRTRSALQQVGLIGFEQRNPHHLSSGEKRRVCLAGVLACEPSLLALDEPTSNLDPRARRELKQLLRELPIPKLIATHDLEMVAELCSRAILLDQGSIIADGNAVELLSNEELMLKHGLERPASLR